MKATDRDRQSDLYFSTLVGSGIYHWDGGFVQDPYAPVHGQEGKSPRLVHLDHGGSFYLKRFSGNDTLTGRLRRQILRPPHGDHVLWPRDMIFVEEMDPTVCANYLGCIKPQKGERALLFSCSEGGAMTDGETMLQTLGEHWDWNTPQVRQMAVSLVQALEDLNRWGYLYLDIHPSRFLFRADGSAVLAYSPLVFDIRDTLGPDAGKVCAMAQECYPIEFAEPALIQKRIPFGDYHSQNYSLCALLFYLFLHRHPYDGAYLSGHFDRSPESHLLKFQAYHQTPVFLFDPDNRRNALGTFAEEQYYIELWQTMPESLRTLFLATLKESNAKRTTPVNNPTPSRWLACFRDLGWMKEKESR